MRKAFNVEESLPEAQRDLVIYCSRQGAADRQVGNEQSLVAAMRAAYPGQEVVVFTGSEGVEQTVQLFRRAKAVFGMHGAGLSHVVFSAPGTAVVEFLFLYDPPMMFWHASGAMGLDYYMVPLARSWWLEQTVHVPEQDVLDVLALIMGPTPASIDCQPGEQGLTPDD